MKQFIFFTRNRPVLLAAIQVNKETLRYIRIFVRSMERPLENQMGECLRHPVWLSFISKQVND